MLALWLLFPALSYAKISVRVKGIPPVYRGIIFSVVSRVVGEAFGRGTTEVLSDKEYYAGTLKEVLDKVVSGYSVERVLIGVSGKVLYVSVRFVPSSEQFQKVDVKLSGFGMLPREVKGILLRELESFRQRAAPIIVGIPVESMEWGEDVLLSRVNRLVGKYIPGFRLANYVEVRGSKMVLRVSPAAPVILKVDIGMFSESIPLLLLRKERPSLLAVSNFLVGLPVKWVKFHKKEIVGYIRKYVAAQKEVNRFRVDVRVFLQLGRISKVDLQVESKVYRIKVLLATYIGAGDKETEVNLHFGYKPTPDWEVYISSWLGVNKFEGRNMLGLSYYLNPSWSVGTEYDVERSVFRLKSTYIWGRKIVEGYYYLNGRGSGVMLGYKITGHIRLDLVYDSINEKEFYLRLSNNL